MATESFKIMPLPEQVVEQLSRESPRTAGWSKQLLMFSSTVFVASLLVYLGIILGYLPYLNSRVEQFDSQIKAFNQKIPAEEQASLIGFYSQLANLDQLLKNHVLISPLFDWLEKNTEANVYFTKLSLNTSNRQVILAGVAKSVGDFTSQLQIFKEDQGVDRLSFNNLSIGAGGLWQFDLVLFFKPGFFFAQK